MESAAINKLIREWSGIQRDDFDLDLNAIHEAEKLLNPHFLPADRGHTDDSLWEMYICELSKICEFGPTHTTAAQRCEALLRTIGKRTDQ